MDVDFSFGALADFVSIDQEQQDALCRVSAASTMQRSFEKLICF
jgi:hypothetical protein